MCIWLNRLSWPHAIHDMPRLFGLSPTYIDVVFNDVLEHFFSRFSGFLRYDRRRLIVAKIQEYANAGGEDGKIWGFIDGTTQQICRPSANQEVFFSGHKGYHAYKWQAVVAPDGLCSSLAGPMPGSRADWWMYQRSELDETISEIFDEAGLVDLRQRVFLYGDTAYTNGRAVIGPYHRTRGVDLSQQQAEFNHRLSRKRVAVENFFGRVQNNWSLMVMRTSHRHQSSLVAVIWAAACSLEDCLMCLRGGNLISHRFGMTPTTLEEYLAVFDIWPVRERAGEALNAVEGEQRL